MLALHNIHVLKGKKRILNGIDFTIKPNQLTIVIGPNGAGKTTLLRVCAGDDVPIEGRVLLNQQPIHDYTIDHLASIRAMMMQSYEINFAFTVEEIVAMGCYVYEETLTLQQRQTIISEVMVFMKIDFLASRRFNSLSGGEQQRTQLARVLAQLWHPNQQTSPRLLLLDEPTASLDLYFQYQVLSLAKQLSQRNIGVLAVLHDLALAATFADELILLDNGQVAASGPPATVLNAKQLSSVYKINAEYFRQSPTTYPTVLIKTDFS